MAGDTLMLSPEQLAVSWDGPVSALFVWLCLLTAARMLYCIIGRWVGFYSPDQFRVFTFLWLPWRWLFLHVWLHLAYWREERKHGNMATARLAGPAETAAHLYHPGYIPLGKSRPFGVGWLGFQPVGLSGESGAHLAMFGKTGGYKTTQLLTLLGLHRGNAFIIDPKGQ